MWCRSHCLSGVEEVAHHCKEGDGKVQGRLLSWFAVVDQKMGDKQALLEAALGRNGFAGEAAGRNQDRLLYPVYSSQQVFLFYCSVS